MLTFAIGDVHGHLDKLDRVLATCARYADGRPMRHVLVGDYVDRGPDSRGVIARAMELTARGAVALKGNHEDMLLAALSDANEDVRFWIDNGGYPTLLSYGIDPIDARLLPAEHLDWMRRRPLFHDDGHRFYCHAGVDPTIPLSEQTRGVLLWTREETPTWADLPRLIVHGHTPVGDGFPDVRRGSVNLDTGCGLGGPLSAAAFDDAGREPVALIVEDEIVEFYPRVRP
jgi:serine/threonine protein phosphatase 1